MANTSGAHGLGGACSKRLLLLFFSKRRRRFCTGEVTHHRVGGVWLHAGVELRCPLPCVAFESANCMHSNSQGDLQLRRHRGLYARLRVSQSLCRTACACLGFSLSVAVFLIRCPVVACRLHIGRSLHVRFMPVSQDDCTLKHAQIADSTQRRKQHTVP
jgi:hypothetical protein